MQDIAINLVSNSETHARTYEQLVPSCVCVRVCACFHEFVVFMGHLT